MVSLSHMRVQPQSKNTTNCNGVRVVTHVPELTHSLRHARDLALLLWHAADEAVAELKQLLQPLPNHCTTESRTCRLISNHGTHPSVYQGTTESEPSSFSMRSA
jgi:hypothetical protein